MQWLRDNWPSFSNNWDLPFGTLTDLIGIGVGLVVLCFTVWVALRQIQIMKRQTAMMEEQSEAGERIERLTAEQAAIAKRQGEIAETQHQALLASLKRRANLQLDWGQVVFYTEDETDFGNELAIVNWGDDTAGWFSWEVRVDHASPYAFERNPAALPGVQITSVYSISEEGHHSSSHVARGYVAQPIYPGMAVALGVTLRRAQLTEKWNPAVKWRVRYQHENSEFHEREHRGFRTLANLGYQEKHEAVVDKSSVDKKTSTL